MAVSVRKRLFTVAEYYRMAEAGILSEDDRVELIEGEVLSMAPIGDRHAGTVDFLAESFLRHLGGRAQVRVQSPIRLGEYSEPQPDIALLKRRLDFYRSRHPGPEDVLLMAEVSETRQTHDRPVKVPLYARYGIPEVWRVDLAEDRLEVFREPTPEGYRSVQTFRRGEAVAPLFAPDVVFNVDDILGGTE
jgi:Uma2 family endonuclease